MKLILALLLLALNTPAFASDLPVAELKPAIREKMTYRKLWKASRSKTRAFFGRLKPTADNLSLNWDTAKSLVRASGPYLGPVASMTGILYNINNFKIQGSKRAL